MFDYNNYKNCLKYFYETKDWTLSRKRSVYTLFDPEASFVEKKNRMDDMSIRESIFEMPSHGTACFKCFQSCYRNFWA